MLNKNPFILPILSSVLFNHFILARSLVVSDMRSAWFESGW